MDFVVAYGIETRGSIPGRDNDQIFSLCHRVQTGSEILPSSYPMGIGGSYPGGKAAGA
jgi:hypothetical protein